MPQKEKLACVDEPSRRIFDKHVEGKLIEHWDELIFWKYSSIPPPATVGNEVEQ